MLLGSGRRIPKRLMRFKVTKKLAMAGAVVGFAVLSLFILPIWNKVSATPCSCTIFGEPTGQSNFADGGSLELGVKFRASTDGYITGVRFYKQGQMSGTHSGRLWLMGNTNAPLATGTFSNESASGWQTLTFSSPVTVTANTVYIASVTMPDGRYVSTPNYFGSDVTNGFLTAPSSGSVGGNGVFNTTAGSYPSSSFNAANYWIDVAYFDQTTPQVTSVTPTNGATGIIRGEYTTATFDQDLDASSLTPSTFLLKDSANNAVDGTVAYNSATKTATFMPLDGLSGNETYTATLKGGSGTTVKNLGGTALAADYSWSFTTTDAAYPCPCTLKDRAAPSGSATFDELGSVELGVKVKPTTNGYITALRFYKPIISAETSHTGKVWSSTGAELASVTFTNESDYGWQEAKLGTPLRVTKGQLYIISYGTSSAIYQASLTGVASSLGSGYLVAPADNSADNAATGSGNRNGVFASTAGNYPGSGADGRYYWVDAVFDIDRTPNYPLSLGVTQPQADAFGVPTTQAVTAMFNRGLDATTVTNSTFRLFDSANNQVSGVATYDTAKGMATFTPGSSLAHGERYTARLSASIADPGGTTLGSEQSWSFTVGSQLSGNINQGPGGPLLVITSSDKYSKYYAEILRAEGLNYFTLLDIGSVNASTLTNYRAAILAETALTQSQADMLSQWVTDGGNLVAMRPDAKLATLLGLTAAGTTRTNQYLLVDTASAPGTGIVGETIQFKGTADNYSLAGASAIANFYSNANTSTTNPAVTTRQVGTKGGTAAAFTYDLAKSVIAQHQGNQAWAGQERDGASPRRSNDLFFGNMTGDVQPDWVDLNKIHIPQADEQQRLLANVLTEATKDSMPLPRFWYLPGDHKAALVMAGDDHGLSNQVGTERVLNDWLNESPTNCSVMDWQCVRASHYLYDNSSITNNRVTQYYRLGFDLGDHVEYSCSNFTSYTELSGIYTSELTTWRAKYSGVPNQKTHRFHCYTWSDWDSQMRVDADNGIRYDLNYVAYPASWLNNRSPLITGSGMNMRFADADGDMLDVYQGVTNLDDTTSNTTAINALLDNALGSTGYYGMFGTHYDMNNNYDDTLFAAARAHNVPTISSAQALAWLDGRNSSAFTNMTGSDGQFSFDITSAEGATNLKAMLPMQDAGGTLSIITVDGNAVTYQGQTIKGVSYAVFTAAPGSYVATYSDYGQTPPDNGGNGNNGGNTGNSGSGSTPASEPQTSAVPAVSRVAQVPTEEQTILPDVTPPTSEGATPTPQTPSIDDAPELETGNTQPFDWWPWLLGLAGILAVLGLWWLLRRRSQSNQASL